MNELQLVFWYAIATLAVVIVCYAGSRAASIAFFRTKLEYFKAVIREGASRNGNEE